MGACVRSKLVKEKEKEKKKKEKEEEEKTKYKNIYCMYVGEAVTSLRMLL